MSANFKEIAGVQSGVIDVQYLDGDHFFVKIERSGSTNQFQYSQILLESETEYNEGDLSEQQEITDSELETELNETMIGANDPIIDFLWWLFRYIAIELGNPLSNS
jgi:hypothetical protein